MSQLPKILPQYESIKFPVNKLAQQEGFTFTCFFAISNKYLLEVGYWKILVPKGEMSQFEDIILADNTEEYNRFIFRLKLLYINHYNADIVPIGDNYIESSILNELKEFPQLEQFIQKWKIRRNKQLFISEYNALINDLDTLAKDIAVLMYKSIERAVYFYYGDILHFAANGYPKMESTNNTDVLK